MYVTQSLYGIYGESGLVYVTFKRPGYICTRNYEIILSLATIAG